MVQLSSTAWQAAKSYLFAHGRKVDQQLFVYYFERGNATQVLTALLPYQNADGGFGHALEPDLRAAASTAIATQQGFNILRAIGAPSSEPTVQHAVQYLLSTLDPTTQVWPIVGPEVEEAPHAPWWTYANVHANFGGFLANPRAALVGFLHDHHTLVPPTLLAQLTDAVLTHLEAQPDQLEMHDLFCYLALANSPNLPQVARSRVVAKLARTVPHTVATDPNLWDGYVLFPLDVAPTPDALLTATIDRTAIDANLDLWIESQAADGSWPLPWTWDFVNKDAWARAERDWKGYHILHRLHTLVAYGRVAC